MYLHSVGPTWMHTQELHFEHVDCQILKTHLWSDSLWLSVPKQPAAANKINMASFRAGDANFGSKCTHAGQEPEQWNSMAVVPPISMATTFKQDGPAEFRK